MARTVTRGRTREYRLEKIGVLIIGCLGLAGTFEMGTAIAIALVVLGIIQLNFRLKG